MNPLTRKLSAGILATVAALSLTACGSAPSEASCKAAALKMVAEVFGQGVDHSDSPPPRECDGFTDAQIQTFVFGGPLDAPDVEAPVREAKSQCALDVEAQRAAGATSIRRSATCADVSDSEIYVMATSR